MNSVAGKCEKHHCEVSGHVYCYFIAGRHLTLCPWHFGRLMSALAQCGLAQRERLSDPQRRAIVEWFVGTRYFNFRRRLSRGRAKRLLNALEVDVQVTGSGEPNPANVLSGDRTIPVVNISASC